MFKRRKTDPAMWINPRSRLGGAGHIAWDRRKADVGNARYLELAAVALNPKTATPGDAKSSIVSDDAAPMWASDQAIQHEGNSSAKVHGMRTTIPVRSRLEHEILQWAIHADVFEGIAAGEPTDWKSWNRIGILSPQQLVIDWRTPHIATYAQFIMHRLHALSAGSRDTYAKAAGTLERLIRRSVNQSRL
jgi:hypothetical protein